MEMKFGTVGRVLLLALGLVLSPGGITWAADVGAKKYCAVEIGSKGVKGAAYSFSASQSGLQVTHYFAKTINTTIVASAKDGFFSPAAIEEAAEAADQLMQAAVNKAGADCQKLVVASSGVVSKGRNSLQDLNKAIARRTGVRNMEAIDADAEADYAHRASVPKQHVGDAVLFDIGSGNTKIGYRNTSDGRFKSLELPWGSTTFTKEAIADMGQFRWGFAKLMVAKVGPEFREKVQATPAVVNRKRIYWVGGAAWAAATWAHPEAINKPEVELTRADIENFMDALWNRSWTDRKPARGMSADEQADWEKAFQRVQETFTPENLLGGVGLMRNMLQDVNPKARLIFPRNGQWLYGYTLATFQDEL